MADREPLDSVETEEPVGEDQATEPAAAEEAAAPDEDQAQEAPPLEFNPAIRVQMAAKDLVSLIEHYNNDISQINFIHLRQIATKYAPRSAEEIAAAMRANDLQWIRASDGATIGDVVKASLVDFFEGELRRLMMEINRRNESKMSRFQGRTRSHSKRGK